MADVVLNIVTPKATYGPYNCDSIHLTICDDSKNQGGGKCGIRKGHAKALLALDEGVVEGYLSEKTIIVGKSGCGFATVNENVVTVVVESFHGEK